MHVIKVVGDRPDFRYFIDLLYGPDRNVDTDGDAEPVHSRDWTYLYVKDRESNDPSVEIDLVDEESLTFKVRSESARLEELTALYLFLNCGSAINVDGLSLDESAIETLKLRYQEELQRADRAIWHQSSDFLPYPNLR